jgi:hypothetical protein
VNEGDYLEEIDVDRRTILKWIVKEWDGSMDSIDLSQDRDCWRTPVNAEMNFHVP